MGIDDIISGKRIYQVWLHAMNTRQRGDRSILDGGVMLHVVTA